MSLDGSAQCRNLKIALKELAEVYPGVHIYNYDIKEQHELKKEMLDIGLEDVPYVVITKKNLMLWTNGAGSLSEERKRYMTVFEGLEKGNYRLDREDQTVKIWDGEGNDEILDGLTF